MTTSPASATPDHAAPTHDDHPFTDSTPRALFDPLRAGLSRRSLLSGGLALGAAAGLGALPAAAADRPTGSGYVRFEDLYRSSMGSSVQALQKVLNVVPAGKILTMPAGIWTIGDGGWNGVNDGVHFRPALRIPTNCAGIWGSGRGGLSSDQGTIIKLTPKTLTANSVGGAAIHAGYSGSTALTLKNLHFLGSDQGIQTVGGGPNGVDGKSPKVFTLVYIYRCPKVLVEDVFVNGWYSNNPAPPGETFGIQVQSCDGHVLRRVEADGRRSIGGLSYGGVGITVEASRDWFWDNCYAHHSNVCASAVVSESVNGRSTNLRIGDSSDNDGTSQFGRKGGGLNHERTTGTVHTAPKIWLANDGKKIHTWHSNDAFTLGSTSCANGSLKITDPTFNDVWGNGRFYVETWGPSYGPDTRYGSKSTMHTAPTVTRSGANLAYKWSRNGKVTLVTSGQYLS